MAFPDDLLVLVAGVLAGIAGLLVAYLWYQNRQQLAVFPAGDTAMGSVPPPAVTSTTPHRHTLRPVRVAEAAAAQPEETDSVNPAQDGGPVGIEAMLLQLEAERTHDSERLQQLRRYFQEVAEQYKLPPFPAVVTTAQRLVRSENIDLRQIGRVLSNDAALAGRILSLSRSPIFGLRNLPRTLQEAISVLGLRTLDRVLVTAGTQSVYAGRSKASRTLWDHSLATALACQILAKRVGIREVDQAFLAGLLHDVGQMVILHGDRQRFEGMWTDVRLQKKSAVEWEQEWYRLNHTWTGASILYRWGLDNETIVATFRHHDSSAESDPTSLDAIVQMANVLADRVGLGFLSAPDAPAAQMFAHYGCDTGEHLQEVSETLKQMFRREKALFA